MWWGKRLFPKGDSHSTIWIQSLVAQMVKRLTTTWETRFSSLGPEDPLEMKRQPIPELLPGKSHGRRSVVGYSPGGRKDSDTNERQNK